MITDTNSKAGTYVNDKKIKEATQIIPGDVITMGTSRFALRRVSEGTVIQQKKKIKQPKISNKKAPSPAGLLGLTNVIHLLLTDSAVLLAENLTRCHSYHLLYYWQCHGACT